MRTVCPERRTLPSNTVPTFNLWATSEISGCSLNEKDEVAAATSIPSMCVSELSSSSVSPSEKYSCSLSPLKLTNGSTAMECEDGAKATALVDATFAGSLDREGASTRTPVTPGPEREARQSA